MNLLFSTILLLIGALQAHDPLQLRGLSVHCCVLPHLLLNGGLMRSGSGCSSGLISRTRTQCEGSSYRWNQRQEVKSAQSSVQPEGLWFKSISWYDWPFDHQGCNLHSNALMLDFQPSWSTHYCFCKLISENILLQSHQNLDLRSAAGQLPRKHPSWNQTFRSSWSKTL